MAIIIDKGALCICQLVILKLRTPSSGRYKESIRAKYSEETDAQESKVYEDIPCPIHNKDGSLTQAKMEPSKAVHKENDLTSQKEDIENSSHKTLLNHYLTPFLPSLIMGLFITPFFISFVNKMTLLDFLTQMQSAPLSIIIAILLFILYIFLKKE